MFQVSKWSVSSDVMPPILKRVLLWAHVKGIPFDLMTHKGLSYVAGLIGEPVKMDDYTNNLTSLNIAHLKVKTDVSKPMPHVVEIRRTSGEIIPVDVEYPWLPPSCSKCKEISHIFRNCLKVNLARVPNSVPVSAACSKPVHVSAAKVTHPPVVSTAKVTPPPLATLFAATTSIIQDHGLVSGVVHMATSTENLLDTSTGSDWVTPTKQFSVVQGVNPISPMIIVLSSKSFSPLTPSTPLLLVLFHNIPYLYQQIIY